MNILEKIKKMVAKNEDGDTISDIYVKAPSDEMKHEFEDAITTMIIHGNKKESTIAAAVVGWIPLPNIKKYIQPILDRYECENDDNMLIYGIQLIQDAKDLERLDICRAALNKFGNEPNSSGYSAALSCLMILNWRSILPIMKGLLHKADLKKISLKDYSENKGDEREAISNFAYFVWQAGESEWQNFVQTLNDIEKSKMKKLMPAIFLRLDDYEFTGYQYDSKKLMKNL